MSDLIDRQAAIDGVKTLHDVAWKNWHEPTLSANIVLDMIRELPTAQPERKTGRWIPVTNGRGGHQCDRCDCYAPSYQSGTEWLSNFCPNCGADMRGEDNG